jgi:hypothetical protein
MFPAFIAPVHHFFMVDYFGSRMLTDPGWKVVRFCHKAIQWICNNNVSDVSHHITILLAGDLGL